jgi:hypothetical protein
VTETEVRDERFTNRDDEILKAFAGVGANLGRAFAAFSTAMNRSLEPMRRNVHALTARRHPKAHVRCHQCHPCANPKPLAVDGREYTRRRKSRRRA